MHVQIKDFFKSYKSKKIFLIKTSMHLMNVECTVLHRKRGHAHELFKSNF